MDRLRPLLTGGTAILAACMLQAQQAAWADLEVQPVTERALYESPMRAHNSAMSVARMQTVAPASVTSLARALPQQKVDKGKVWLIVVAGAVSLFGAAILLENNETFFPAIAKANKAMAQARKAQQVQLGVNA